MSSALHLVRCLGFPPLDRRVIAVTSGCITTCPMFTTCIYCSDFSAITLWAESSTFPLYETQESSPQDSQHHKSELWNNNSPGLFFFVSILCLCLSESNGTPQVEKQEHPQGNLTWISIPGSQNTCFRTLLNAGRWENSQWVYLFLLKVSSSSGCFYSSLRDRMWWWRWISGYCGKQRFLWGNLFGFHFSSKFHMNTDQHIST